MGHDGSHANAGGQLAVAFGGNDTSGPREVSTALSAKGGVGRMDFESETLIAHTLTGGGFDASEDGTGRGCPIVPVAGTMPAAGATERKHGHGWGQQEWENGYAVPTGWAVRRLTPLECERLQGFPDGWTDVPYRGKRAADGPRYKALGNSMAVNCMSWIGQRIDLFATLTAMRAA